MRKVRINTGNVGLVFRKGNYQKVLTDGVYILRPSKRVIKYDLSKPFYSPIELNILLRDEELANQMHVVEVKDNEIVLMFENGNFKSVLTPGRYAFWKGVVNYEFVVADLSKIEINENIDVSVLQRSEVLRYVRIYFVEAYEKGLLFVDGKFQKYLETGVYYFWNNSTSILVLKADLRQLQMEISGQEILTKDKAALRVNFYTKYKVVDVDKALLENKNYEKQLYILMQLALREYIGKLSLDELLEKKDSLSESISETINGKAKALGVEILDSGIRDVILPGEVKEIMNQVLVAEKKAQANIITRREETASTRSLLNTAKLMEGNNMLFKLKEMEYVEKIADKINSISLSGGNQIVDQLKEIFSPGK